MSSTQQFPPITFSGPSIAVSFTYDRSDLRAARTMYAQIKARTWLGRLVRWAARWVHRILAILLLPLAFFAFEQQDDTYLLAAGGLFSFLVLILILQLWSRVGVLKHIGKRSVPYTINIFEEGFEHQGNGDPVRHVWSEYDLSIVNDKGLLLLADSSLKQFWPRRALPSLSELEQIVRWSQVWIRDTRVNWNSVKQI